jgi:3-isopropylmalate dehydratase large subunit
MVQDVNAPFVIESFDLVDDASIWDRSKAPFVLDHFAPAPTRETAQRHSLIRSFLKQGSIPSYGVGEGICHQLLIENGHVLPGGLVVATDSHACSYGALNAMGISVGAADMAVTLASGLSWFRVPESVLVKLEGTLPEGVTAKDAALEMLRRLTQKGAMYACVEFGGGGLSTLSIGSRITLCNMASEAGAKSAVMPFDDALGKWLGSNGTPRDEGVGPDPDARYASRLSIDRGSLRPKIARSPNIDDVVDVVDMAGEPVDQVIIGSCTNGRFEDFDIAAKYMEGKKVAPNVRMILLPASRTILSQLSESGLLKLFIDAGAIIYPPGCGPCAGRHGGLLADGETALSTTNRNVPGRMGSKKAKVHIVSPVTAALSAISGFITPLPV